MDKTVIFFTYDFIYSISYMPRCSAEFIQALVSNDQMVKLFVGGYYIYTNDVLLIKYRY